MWNVWGIFTRSDNFSDSPSSDNSWQCRSWSCILSILCLPNGHCRRSLMYTTFSREWRASPPLYNMMSSHHTHKAYEPQKYFRLRSPDWHTTTGSGTCCHSAVHHYEGVKHYLKSINKSEGDKERIKWRECNTKIRNDYGKQGKNTRKRK